MKRTLKRLWMVLVFSVLFCSAFSTVVFAKEVKRVTVEFRDNGKKAPDISARTSEVSIEKVEWQKSWNSLNYGDSNIATITFSTISDNSFDANVTWDLIGKNVSYQNWYPNEKFAVLETEYKLEKRENGSGNNENHNNQNNKEEEKHKDGLERDHSHWYYYKDGEKVESDWVKIRDNWYYFNSTGKMLESTTKKIDGEYYRFDSEGRLVKGWTREDDGRWCYYSKSSGIQLRDEWLENDREYSGTFYFDSNGSMHTGWKLFGGNTWYYFDQSGYMKKNTWIPCNNRWCYVGVNGVMYTNWAQVDGKWYYFDNNGYCQ